MIESVHWMPKLRSFLRIEDSCVSLIYSQHDMRELFLLHLYMNETFGRLFLDLSITHTHREEIIFLSQILQIFVTDFWCMCLYIFLRLRRNCKGFKTQKS